MMSESVQLLKLLVTARWQLVC